DRCTNPVQLNHCTINTSQTCLTNANCTGLGDTCVMQFNTICEVAQRNDDPFVSGANYPTDTEAICAVDLGDFGGVGSSAHLIDACSYPSSSVNSDPSDCVLFSACTTNADCNDGNPCTTDTCAVSNTCTHSPSPGTLCDDGNACTTGDTCDNLGFCVGVPSCPTATPTSTAATATPTPTLTATPT